LFDDFADELSNERQPRALIILVGAQIDELLREILIASLLEAKEYPKKDEPLDVEAPLSTFSSRIKMVYRLGIIDEPLQRVLDKFRDLRNNAAHWIAFGIAETSLKDRLSEFQRVMKSRRAYRLTVRKFFGGRNDLSSFEELQPALL
jgi:hypothetical protein